jgi:cyclic pyranopterin phosphate synthase
MPIGCGWQAGYRGVPLQAVRRQLEAAYGPLIPVTPIEPGVFGPASYYKIPSWAGEIGFIDALEHKFCHNCNRVRLTADGYLKLCLNQRSGLDVKALLRRGISEDELGQALAQAVYRKPAEHLFGELHGHDWRAMYQVGG